MYERAAHAALNLLIEQIFTYDVLGVDSIVPVVMR